MQSMLNTPPYPQMIGCDKKEPQTSSFSPFTQDKYKNKYNTHQTQSIDRSIVTTVDISNHKFIMSSNDDLPKVRPDRSNIQSRFHSISPVPSHKVLHTEPIYTQVKEYSPVTPKKNLGTIQTVCSPNLSPNQPAIQTLSLTNKKISESLYITLQQLQEVKQKYEDYQQKVKVNYVKKTKFDALKENVAQVFEENQDLKKQIEQSNRKIYILEEDMKKRKGNIQEDEVQKVKFIYKSEIYSLSDKNQELRHEISILKRQNSSVHSRQSCDGILKEININYSSSFNGRNDKDIDLENQQLKEENSQLISALQQANQQVANLKAENDKYQKQVINLQQSSQESQHIINQNLDLQTALEIMKEENQQLTEFCENFVKDNKKLHEQVEFYQSNSQSQKSLRNNDTFCNLDQTKEHEQSQICQEKDKIIQQLQKKYSEQRNELQKVKEQLQNYVNIVKGFKQQKQNNTEQIITTKNKENIPNMNSDKKQ